MTPVKRALLGVLCVQLLVACSAQRVLFQPTSAEQALLAEPPIDLTVRVVRWSASEAKGRSADAYARPLAQLLERSHAFKSVIYDSADSAHADLIAESLGDYCNSAIIPVFTIVTIGIVPTVWTETECTGVVFRRTGDSTSSTASAPIGVHVRREGRAMLGWLAAPTGLMPGWSWKSGKDQGAYQQAFRLAIIQHRAELVRLADRR
jgi:hypothetical protein